MTTRGHGGCCCGGCAEPPHDHSLDVDGLQPLARYCCACIPKQICVTYVCSGGESSDVLLTVSHPCSNPDTSKRKSIYTGDLVVNGELADIEFSFAVEGESCYFGLTSTYFGADAATDRVLIDASFRDVLCRRCQATPGDYIEFSVTDSNCGTYAVLRVKPAANVSLEPLDDCCDRTDPCADVVGETEALKSCAPCAGCGCICEKACITTVIDGEAVTEVVNLCNWKYHLSNGLIIEVADDGSGCCELSLDIGDLTPDFPLAGVSIGGIDNPCPNPTAEWEFNTTGEYVQSYQVIFNCYGCSECLQVVAGYGQCCGEAATIPKVLTATVDGGVDCCGSFTMTLIYDEVTGNWVGYHPTAFCNHEIRLTMNCGATWTITLDALGGCTQETVAADSAQCEPVNIVFSIPAAGVGCCDLTAGGYTLTVTVTE